jgi:hypothetical protein
MRAPAFIRNPKALSADPHDTHWLLYLDEKHPPGQQPFCKNPLHLTLYQSKQKSSLLSEKRCK